MKLMTIGTTTFMLKEYLKENTSIEIVQSIIKENILQINNDYKNIKNYNEINKIFNLEAKKIIIRNAKNADYIILDLLDEFYDNIIINNDRFTFNFSVNKNEFSSITIEENSFDDIWCKNAEEYIRLLVSLKNEKSIIINEVYLCEYYYDDQNTLKAFDEIEKLKIVNSKLKKMYEFIKKIIPNAIVIKTSNNYADKGHKYLCKSYLLSNIYYTKLIESLEYIADNQKEKYIVKFNRCNLSKAPDIISYKVDSNKIDIEITQKCKNTLIGYWENFKFKYDKINNIILPRLSEGKKYKIKLFNKYKLGDINAKLLFVFYDANNNKISQICVTESNCIVNIPSKYDNYTIYFQLVGEGKGIYNNILIEEFNEDNVIINSLKSQKTFNYIFDEGALDELVVVFYNNKLGIYESSEYNGKIDINIHKLFIDISYDMNFNYDSSNDVFKLIDYISKKYSIKKEKIVFITEDINCEYCFKISEYINNKTFILLETEYLDKNNTEIIYNNLNKYFKSDIGKNNIELDIYLLSNLSNKSQGKLLDKLTNYKKIINIKRYEYENNMDKCMIINGILKVVLDSSFKNITILGSCDSRDIFRICEEYKKNNIFKLSDYYARSSIISLMSKSIQLPKSGIHLTSKFKVTSVERDFNKAFIKQIEKIKNTSDFLIIDFMEERFDIVKYNNSYITYNWEMREAKLDKEVNGRIISRLSDECTQIWKESCLEFIKIISMYFKPSQIILNRVCMVDEYFDGDCMYKFNDQKYIIEFNKLLNEYYQFFEENFDGINIINIKKHLYCDSNHLWGKFPYHFNDAFYLLGTEKMINIVENQKVSKNELI